MKQLLTVDNEAWLKEAEEIGQYFSLFGDHLPGALRDELQELKKRVETNKA